MKKFFGALAVALLMATSAQASTFTNYLTFDGLVDTVKDDSLGEFVDGGVAEEGGAGANGIFDAGDKFFGLMAISDINGTSVTDQIVVLFAIEITGGTGTNADPLTHKAVAAADPFSLKSLLTGAPLLAAKVTDATIGLVISHPGILPEPLTFVGGASSASNMAKFLDAEWDFEMSIGFVEADDFFHAAIDDPGPPIDARERGGFTIIEKAFGGSILPVTVTRFTGAPGGPTSTHDVGLVSPTTFTNAPAADSPWDLSDSATFNINVVPEPTSMLVWGGMMAFGLAYAARRRFQKKAA